MVVNYRWPFCWILTEDKPTTKLNFVFSFDLDIVVFQLLLSWMSVAGWIACWRFGHVEYLCMADRNYMGNR